MQLLLKFFPKNWRGGDISKIIYKARITQIPKPDKNTTKKLQANIPDEYRCDNSQQNTSKPSSTAHRKDYTSKPSGGTSLVVQWLRIRLPIQGTWVRSLVQEDPTCHRATQPVCHKYWTCALEPTSHNYWAHVPQLLKPTCPRAHAPQLLSPCTTTTEAYAL